jgi:hypothetical protein
MYWFVGLFPTTARGGTQVIGLDGDCGFADTGYKARDDRTRCAGYVDEPKVYKILRPVGLRLKTVLVRQRLKPQVGGEVDTLLSERCDIPAEEITNKH